MAARDRKPVTERRDRQAFQDRRLQAAELFQQGIHQAEVARTLGVSRQTASRWQQRWQSDSAAGLASRGAPGRSPKLSDAQLEQVQQALLEGAKAHGFDTNLWTLGRIAEVIWRTTGVRHHPAHVWRLLRHQLGWSLQRPTRRAQERNEQAIRQWVASDWPRVKKTPGAGVRSSASSTSPASR
ncbi:MAG TPA: winged helix-turn-helix domain-containing protein [Actinomycetes bacterium]